MFAVDVILSRLAFWVARKTTTAKNVEANWKNGRNCLNISMLNYKHHKHASLSRVNLVGWLE